jgi:hypothetical protein
MDLKASQLWGASELTVFPFSLEELEHDHLHVVTARSKRQPQGSRGLSLSVARMNDDQSLFLSGCGACA